MHIYIPYDPGDPKTRLSPRLSADERRSLSRAMLADVRACVERAGHEPVVLATRSLGLDGRTRVSAAPLSEAVDGALRAAEPDPETPVGVVMADLGLLTPRALTRLVDAAADVDVAMAPGRRAGTNAFVARSPAFEVDFHGASFLDHRAGALAEGLRLATVDSFRLATDIDEPSDLLELFVHGRGRSQRWVAARFDLDRDRGELVRTAETTRAGSADAWSHSSSSVE